MQSYYRPKKSKDAWKQYVLDQLRPLKRIKVRQDQAAIELRQHEVTLQDSERKLAALLDGIEGNTERARYAADFISRQLCVLQDIKQIVPELPSTIPFSVSDRFRDHKYAYDVLDFLDRLLNHSTTAIETLQAQRDKTPKIVRIFALPGIDRELSKHQKQIGRLRYVLGDRRKLVWAFRFLADTDWQRAVNLEIEIEGLKILIRNCRRALGLTTKSKPSPGTLRARVAAIDKRSRELAARHRDYLPRLDNCPYCQQVIADGGHRLDHIYPVKLGGLSIPENLVWVCDPCNSAKRDRGLSDFLISQGYPLEPVLERLRALGKHV